MDVFLFGIKNFTQLQYAESTWSVTFLFKESDSNIYIIRPGDRAGVTNGTASGKVPGTQFSLS